MKWIEITDPSDLAVGSTYLLWNPSSKDITVHKVHSKIGEGRWGILDKHWFNSFSHYRPAPLSPEEEARKDVERLESIEQQPNSGAENVTNQNKQKTG